MKYVPRFFIALMLLLLAAPFALAGHYIEQQRHTDAMTVMGQTQPARDSVQKIWMDADKMASDTGDQTTVIIRLDQNKIYFVNHAKKSYSVTDLPMKFPPEMEKMMAAFQFKTDLQKTGERKQIGPYSCEGVNMTLSGFMNFNVKMWVTSDIKLPFSQYYTMSSAMTSYSPALKEMTEKMRSLGNVFAVEQEMTGEVMGTKTHSVTRLVKYDETVIPASKFEPPAGYTEQPLDFQKLMSQQQ
jgi:hypothetical protein